MQTRAEVWKAIQEEPECTVLILGGGVDGIGVFRDLALQGVDCLLIDKADFTAGASSKSSRMIHGGLRYLENREIGLVYEAVRERNRLLENAPHYVAPLKTTIPLVSWFAGMIRSPLHFFGLPVTPRGRGGLIVKCALVTYDLLTGRKRRIPRHFVSGKRSTRSEMPQLHPDVIASATYWDAWVSQIERLCIELLQAGTADGLSKAINYVNIEAVNGETVTLKNQATGETTDVKPQVVINATGAWVDLANKQLGIDTKWMGGTKGSHLVVDNAELYEALGDRMIFYEHDDGRVCIVFRFMDKVIMGSTDIRIEDPDDAECDEDEVEYMVETLQGVFPDIKVTREQIVFKFCGVRPLAAAGDSVTGTISRGHRIETTEPADGRAFPVYSMIGGKLSTFRSFAEQTCDAVLERIGKERVASTEDLPIGGGEAFPEGDDAQQEWIRKAATEANIDEQRMAILLERYGTAAKEMATAVPNTPLTNHPDYTIGEIQKIVAGEMVEHLDDLICRRSVLALLGAATPELLSELGDVVGETLGWDADRRAAEVAAAKRVMA